MVVVAYLCEYEYTFKTVLAHEAGTQGDCLMRKSCETVPLNSILYYSILTVSIREVFLAGEENNAGKIGSGQAPRATHYLTASCTLR
jgi:hypothetical protein